MEFVLAFLLFFGGLALGSNSADKGEGESQPSSVLPDAGGISVSHQPTQAMRQSNLNRCYSGRVTVYKDLTEPYLGQVDQRESQSFCNGDCPDE